MKVLVLSIVANGILLGATAGVALGQMPLANGAPIDDPGSPAQAKKITVKNPGAGTLGRVGLDELGFAEVAGLGRVKVISGKNLHAGFLDPQRDSEEEGRTSRVLDTSPVLIDGWTAFLGETNNGAPETLENENYSFSVPTIGDRTVTFCAPIKVPRSGLASVSADLIVIPSTRRIGGQNSDLPPATAVNLFIDDIPFGNVLPGNSARQVIAFVDFARLEDAIGATGTFDWFLIMDFAANLQTDDDMDGSPDVALEINGGNVQFKLTDTLDQVGADVVDFFTGNANKVNVFEPRGSLPAPRIGFPGMLPGEDGTTRPWSFVLQ